MAEPSFKVVTATPELLARVVKDVRQADVDELWATAHLTPAEVLELAARYNDIFIAMADDEVLCAFGVVPLSILGGVGSPWMFGTTHLAKHAKRFLRRCKPGLDAVLGRWPTLRGFVDVRNKASIRWLKWLGFKLSAPEPFGPFGLPFHHFILER